jgi:hypothetical protein
VNNGRGGRLRGLASSFVKTLIEFKRGSTGAEVIANFSAGDEARAANLLTELKLTDSPDIIVIDARRDNKPSASTARTVDRSQPPIEASLKRQGSVLTADPAALLDVRSDL